MNIKQEKPGKDNKSSSFRELRRSAGCSNIIGWIIPILILVAVLWGSDIFTGINAETEIPYSQFKAQLSGENIASVSIQGEEIKGTLIEPATQNFPESDESVEYETFVTYLPSFGDEELMPMLEEQEVEIQARPESEFSFLGILFSVLPFLFLLGIGFLIFRQMRSQGGNVMSIGKSQAKLYDRQQERTTFNDVAGAKGVKAELQEIIEFLKDPGRFQKLGGEMPKGVLLVGPPGTGKTLLARAVAGEARVPFFNITGSNFMEMFVGVGASRVRDLFKEAKKASPAIIFIDELDSIGRRRGTGLGGSHDEREQTLNQLLNEMDGFEVNEDVVVMAATNRPDILDPALLRPGRFDRRVIVDLPTSKDRIEILRIHSRNKPLADDVDLEKIARSTPGFSGADLENLLNEAALLGARKEHQVIQQEDIEDAKDKLILGLERENVGLSEAECELLAYHESGHAVVAAAVPNADPIHKITIVPRGRAMGRVEQLPEGEKYIYNREYILDRLAVMMGGRAAEELILNTTSSGAENDLKQATKLARKMVLDWGMSEEFQQIAFGSERQQVFLGEEFAHRREYSEDTARLVDKEVIRILSQAFQSATDTIKDYRDEIDDLVELLIEEEELPGSKVLELLGMEEKKGSESSEAHHPHTDEIAEVAN